MRGTTILITGGSGFPGALEDYRTINRPNLAPTAQEITEAVMRQQRPPSS